MSPRIYSQDLNGVEHQSIAFDTLTYAVFNYFHSLFYRDGKKVVPENIGDLLTAQSLAY